MPVARYNTQSAGVQPPRELNRDPALYRAYAF
jgi:hypothetical protein